jgi:hypothetical protein
VNELKPWLAIAIGSSRVDSKTHETAMGVAGIAQFLVGVSSQLLLFVLFSLIALGLVYTKAVIRRCG